jgi:hypothetical protein
MFNFGRFLTGLASLTFTFLAIMVAILGQLATNRTGSTTTLFWWLLGGGVVGFGFLLWQAYAEYRKLTYDPTVMFRYQETWDEMKAERSRAARLIRDHPDKLASPKENQALLRDIDDPLDVLDDIGFYLKGDQISPEVAHQHFDHWIRGYSCAAHDYIDAWRKEEPTRWEHVGFLYDKVTRIEAKRSKKRPNELCLTPTKIAEFLDDEISEGDDGTPRAT